MKPTGDPGQDLEPVEMELSELCTQLVMSIVEGREPNDSIKGHSLGQHYPLPPGQGVAHDCHPDYPKCRQAKKLARHVRVMCENNVPISLQVMQLPDCCHDDFELCCGSLLERWTLQTMSRRSLEMQESGQVLLQAVRSYIHFSQISSWLSLTHGKQPKNLIYRLSVPGETLSSVEFSKAPEEHSFPVGLATSKSLSLRVLCEALPRLSHIPDAACSRPPSKGCRSGDQEVTPAKVKAYHHPATDITPTDSNTASPHDIGVLSSRTSAPSGEQRHVGSSSSHGSNSQMPQADRSGGGDSAADSQTTERQCASAGSKPSNDDKELTLPSALSTLSISHHPLEGRLEPRTGSTRGLLPLPHGHPSDHHSASLESRCEPRSGGTRGLLPLPHGHPSDHHSASLESRCEPRTGVTRGPSPPRTEEAGGPTLPCHGGPPSLHQLTAGATSEPTTSEPSRETVRRQLYCHHQASRLTPEGSRTRPGVGHSLVDGSAPGGKTPDHSQSSQTAPTLPRTSRDHQASVQLSLSSGQPPHKPDDRARVEGSNGFVTNGDGVKVEGANGFLSGGKAEPVTRIQNGRRSGSSDDPTAFPASQNNSSNSTTRQSSTEIPLPKPTPASNGAFHNPPATQPNFRKSQPLFPDLSFTTGLPSISNKTLAGALQKQTSVGPKQASASEKARFRRSLDLCTKTSFNGRTGLPINSSPAPPRRTNRCLNYDDTILAASPASNGSSSDEDCACLLSKSAPATTSSLLGNFEESILNSRIEPVGMIEGFTVDIGASGHFCPQHITLPVTTYFYDLSDDNKPSPYSGFVNLEKHSRKGYHVPKKGTIQVTLFNPNKTVLKMFVVLYDLSDMPANCQTFLRQRTFYTSSAPPPAPSQTPWGSATQKELRYLIHLRFQSSRSGHVYLHTDIRMIFARNRPDLDLGSTPSYELKSYTEAPENPRFSPKK